MIVSTAIYWNLPELVLISTWRTGLGELDSSYLRSKGKQSHQSESVTYTDICSSPFLVFRVLAKYQCLLELYISVTSEVEPCVRVYIASYAYNACSALRSHAGWLQIG